MPELAALDGVHRQVALAHLAGRLTAVGGLDDEPIRRDLHHVAFFQIHDAVGDLDQRLHVGTQEVLADADAHAQRTAAARADHVAGMVAVQHSDRVRATQAPRGVTDRFAQRLAFGHQFVHQVRDDLGIGVRGERVTGFLQLGAEFRMVLDDAVVHHRHRVARHVRMGIGFVGNAMGSPAGVRDAGAPVQGRCAPQRVQFRDLPGCPQARKPAIVQHRQSRRVIAAIFEGMQARQQDGHHIALGAGGDDSAHGAWSSGSKKHNDTGILRAESGGLFQPPARFMQGVPGLAENFEQGLIS